MQNKDKSSFAQFSLKSKFQKMEQSTVLPSSIGSSSTINTELSEWIAEQERNERIANEIVASSTAKVAATTIYNKMIKFQKELDNTHDIALSLVQFGASMTVFVDGVGYSGYNLVVFYGTDVVGNKVELIQHINQLSFILISCPKEVEMEKRKIGFVG